MISWAYEFQSDQSLSQIEAKWNQAGPWKWSLRDCAWYPDFLQSRPQTGVRICLYEVKPPGGPGYRCLIESQAGSGLTRTLIDPIVLSLFGTLPAEGTCEIEACEWPFD